MGRKIENLPNTITISRILLSVLLLFSKPFGLTFFIVYTTCGVSDMVDGYIARKTNTISKLGMKLDSIADIVFTAAVLVTLLPVIKAPLTIWLWIAVIALIRVASLITGYFKYRAFAALHTYANKATGLLLFCFPFLYVMVDTMALEYLLCIVASMSAIEDLVINITSKKFQGDIKGIFLTHRSKD
ncbi:MAG: CDP-alcohol phosphatidyltransferase family protein [Clostridiaceae bacterium]